MCWSGPAGSPIASPTRSVPKLSRSGAVAAAPRGGRSVARTADAVVVSARLLLTAPGARGSRPSPDGPGMPLVTFGAVGSSSE